MGNKRVIISRRLGRLGWIESVERVRRREGKEENKYVKRESERSRGGERKEQGTKSAVVDVVVVAECCEGEGEKRRQDMGVQQLAVKEGPEKGLEKDSAVEWSGSKKRNVKEVSIQ